MITNNGHTVMQGHLPDGSLDVNIQDQTSPPIDLYFTQPNAGPPTTLTVPTALGDVEVTVASTANIGIGDYLGIFSGASGEQRFYFGAVTDINGLLVEVDSPVDFAFDAGDTVLASSRDMNVLGTHISPQIYAITNGTNLTNQPIDINRIILTMDTATAPEWDEFGDLDALIYGILLRRVDGDTRNIFNLKSNSDMAQVAFDVNFRSPGAPPSTALGGVSCRITFNGQDKHGVAIRLFGGDSLQFVIQDDLTGLEKFRVMGQGQLTVGEDVL